MNTQWQEFLGAAGASFDKGLVTGFGDEESELKAARDATIIAPLAHLGLLECTGDEAKAFLHNQVTSDINHLGVDAAQHSAWCSAKGRMLVSFLLFRNGPDFQIQLAADLAPATLKRLQMYILRAKVKVSDLSNRYQLIGLSGVQAEAALQEALLPVPQRLLDAVPFAEGKVIRLDATRFEIVVGNEVAGELWRKLAVVARPVGTRAWQWLEVQAGVPLITDATKEEFVPQMANFDQLGGVSFHKGCYPGQEIIARTQYLGKVKRHLYRLDAAVPMAAGDAVYSPENPEHPCGMVVNAAPAPDGGYAALAVIQENFVAAGDLELGAPGGPRIDTQLVSF
ncbi:MAG: CAF17-like 4Fe-4S cluster assembly/insertion protein YgfZ [Rhodanobacter sp.]